MFFIPKLELLILSSLFLPNLNLYKIYLAKLFYFLPHTKMYPANFKIYFKKYNRYFFEVLKYVFEKKMYYENNTKQHNFQHIHLSYTFLYKTFMDIYSIMKIILHNIQYFSSRIFQNYDIHFFMIIILTCGFFKLIFT